MVFAEPRSWAAWRKLEQQWAYPAGPGAVQESRQLLEQMLLQARIWEDRLWFIPSSCPSFFHRASPLASLGARRQGGPGNIAPRVTVQAAKQKMHLRENRQTIHMPSLTPSDRVSPSYAPWQHIRPRIIITLILLHSYALFTYLPQLLSFGSSSTSSGTLQFLNKRFLNEWINDWFRSISVNVYRAFPLSHKVPEDST